MAFVYRYDNWATHMHMEGGQLRAQHWSLKKGAHPHRSLIESEKILPAGQGLFRISFWKTEQAMFRWTSASNWPSLHVLQRVRDDHPFLQTFTKEVDDYLEESAWLYWKAGDIAKGQGWSDDGIPKRDIEVLDFDGSWRPYEQSEIMRPEAETFRQLGFESFHYLMGGVLPSTVFATCKLIEIDGEMQFVVLITDPVCQAARVYNDTHVIAHIFQLMHRHAIDFSLSRCRVFVMSDARTKFDHPNLAELPLAELVTVHRHYNKLFRLIPLGYTEIHKFGIHTRTSLRWHSHQGKLFEKIAQSFSMPCHLDRLEKYVQLHQRLRAEKCPDLLYP